MKFWRLTWSKCFVGPNQAGSSPHKKWMKFSANYFSWRDSFSFCGTTREPHWIWLAARTGLRIFSDRQVARLDLIFQKQQNQSKAFTGKQETHTTVQALKFIF
jgi:hypothetical protein